MYSGSTLAPPLHAPLLQRVTPIVLCDIFLYIYQWQEHTIWYRSNFTLI